MACPVDERRVPCCSHAGRLRELCCGDGGASPLRAGVRDETVDALGASEAGNAEARHAAPSEAVNLLVNGHEREDVVDAFFGSEVWILEGIFVLRRLRVLRKR